MITPFDRDPVTFEITEVSTGVSPQLMPALQPRRKNEIWVCEYVSVWTTYHVTNSTLDTYIVELGVDHRGHITWLDYITLSAGRWTRILDHPITLLSDTLPRCRFWVLDAGLTLQMNAVGYIRAPFTSP
ncbi:hypothetical protein ES703_41121 [subsurface metagenome]